MCVNLSTSLYTSKEDDGPQLTFFQQVNGTVLGIKEQESCVGPLCEKECAEAVKSMIQTVSQPNFTKFSGRYLLPLDLRT